MGVYSGIDEIQKSSNTYYCICKYKKWAPFLAFRYLLPTVLEMEL